nr:MAG TPA: hypothetical protein [Caudoviricetes sp.]
MKPPLRKHWEAASNISSFTVMCPVSDPCLLRFTTDQHF